LPAKPGYSRRVAVESTDEELLACIGEGDRNAFEEIWRRFSRPVLTLAVRILDDRSAAEDAAQEAFAAVWRASGSFDPGRGDAAGWIYAIARNAARDSLRRRRTVPVADLPERADPGPQTDDLVSDRLDAFVVHRAISGLPARSRQVIELAYYEGLSQSEIATRTETALGTVKTRTRNALAALAVTLGQAEGP